MDKYFSSELEAREVRIIGWALAIKPTCPS